MQFQKISTGILSTFFVLSFLPSIHADPLPRVKDRYLEERAQMIEVKTAKAEEIGRQIENLEAQLNMERRKLVENNEKIWRDFSQSLEVDRKELRDRLQSLDSKQSLFEIELDRKRQQDEVRLQEKELEMKRMMKDLERMRKEMEEDRKALIEARESQRANQKVLDDARPATSLQPGSPEIAGEDALRKVQGDALKLRSQSRQSAQEYYVEEGDILGIEFWRAKDLSRRITVRPDGRISMPLVGDLDVMGLTLTQVRELITESYKEFIRDPQVSISIEGFGGRKFIALGEVRSPGVYRYQQSISLVEAIGLAGGLSADAHKGKIMIIRGDIRKSPQVKVIGANIANILKRGMISENLTIMPNDILYVGKDFLGDFNEFIDDVVQPSLNSAIDSFVLRSAIRTAQDRRN